MTRTNEATSEAAGSKRDHYEDQIDWDFDTFVAYEEDLDGHGTQEGHVTGRKETGRTVYIYEGVFTHVKCCDDYELVEGSVEVLCVVASYE